MRSATRAWLLALALVLGADAHPAAAQQGEIEGDLPEEGIAAVAWTGGSVDQLTTAAEAGGCMLRSAWVFVEGAPVGYLAGAPDFVNAGFLEIYPGGEIEDRTLMLLVCARPGPSLADVSFVAAFGGRVFDQPVELVPYPGGRFLVAEQDGRVLLVNSAGDTEAVFLDLTASVRRQGSEEGLLSVALDPAFEQNRHVWVYYSVAGGGRRTRLARFEVQGDAAVRDSELAVLEVAQPYSNHNGGAVRFGPDGMLYLGLGDGGGSGDPLRNGQDTGTLLGTIIRIDVRNATASQPYVVPPDNPFTGGGGRGEVWAYGFRNPWRMSFDPDTGDLWAGDVGQSRIEEIDVVERGGNYGWSELEGNDCYRDGCTTAGTVLPVATYTHDEGCSVTGGVVYRGTEVPALQGAYVFADYCSGRVWAIDASAEGAEPRQVARVDGRPTSFAAGPDGALYLVQFDGPVLRAQP